MDEITFSFFLCDIVRLPFDSNITKVGVSRYIDTNGFLTEDEIQISLKPRLRYQLVAATLNSVTLKDNVVNVPRLAPRQEVSAVLLVEGEEFSQSEIAAATSKEAVVRILKDSVPPPPPPAQWVAALLVIGFVTFVPAYLASEFTENLGRNAFSVVFDVFRKTTADKRAAFEKEGWSGLSRFFEMGGLHTYYDVGRFPIEKVVVSRKGDLILITADAVNMTPDYLEFAITAIVLDTGGTLEYRRDKTHWSETVAAKGTGKVHLELKPPKDQHSDKLMLQVYLRGDAGWATIRKAVSL